MNARPKSIARLARPAPGVFQKEATNNLADLGRRMGAAPAGWAGAPPPP